MVAEREDMHLCQRGICYSNFMEGQITGQNPVNTFALNHICPPERFGVQGSFSLPSAPHILSH